MVGQALQHVTNIDHNGVGVGGERHPLAFMRLHFQAGRAGTDQQGDEVDVAMGAGAAATGLIAAVVARPIFKLKGNYLAMATLGLGIIISIALRNEAQWTGGPDGMPVPAMGLFGFELSNDKQWYWVVAILLSVSVWAHHMYATGAVLLPFFSFMTFLIAVPTGIKFFNWIGTMWRGHLSFASPMLFAVGFLVTFLFGGLTGVILAAPALDASAGRSLPETAETQEVRQAEELEELDLLAEPAI